MTRKRKNYEYTNVNSSPKHPHRRFSEDSAIGVTQPEIP